MSIKFSSFDAMSRQNKIAALVHIKGAAARRREDYLLLLHAVLDADDEVRMTAKMAANAFSAEPYFINLKGLSPEELKTKLAKSFSELAGGGATVHRWAGEATPQILARDLQLKVKKRQFSGEWDGPFPRAVDLLNTLRDDTIELVQGLLAEGETIEHSFLGFFHESLVPFRDGQKSLDSSAASTIIHLNRIEPETLSPSLSNLFSLLESPIYLLVIFSSQRLILFLREKLGESAAAVLPVPYGQISKVTLGKEGGSSYLDLETSQDLIHLPDLHEDDAHEAERILREKSISAITAQEEFIERDFDKELNRLDMLFKARTIKLAEFLFRKQRLQKMELEKFSDANVELLLAKRFADTSLGEKFDRQILQKFTVEKTIMFTDIVGYSRKAAEKQLIDTMTLLAVHDKMLMPIIEEHQGQLIKKIGDALMVKFDSPLAACRAAIEMQHRLIEFNRTSTEKILIRIGLNTGTVFAKGGDVFGDAVNLAARMEALAIPGWIYLTERTFEQVGHDLPCCDCGTRQVKGQTHPLRVFAIIDESDASREMIEQGRELRQEMGLEEPESHTSTDFAGVVATPVPTASPTAASSTFVPEAAIGSDFSQKWVPTTPEEAMAQLDQAFDAAVAAYRQAVALGEPRNGNIEAWLNHYAAHLRSSRPS
jgi:class 3 adenylate cyclase